MTQPKMMQPTCSFCGKEFTPGPLALLGLPAKISADNGRTFEDTRLNACDPCRQQIERAKRIFEARQKAILN